MLKFDRELKEFSEASTWLNSAYEDIKFIINVFAEESSDLEEKCDIIHDGLMCLISSYNTGSIVLGSRRWKQIDRGFCEKFINKSMKDFESLIRNEGLEDVAGVMLTDLKERIKEVSQKSR